jgi:DNA repair proteins
MKAITTWNEEDRPRERLFAKGADALKNEELLAILLRTGTNDQSAVGIGSTILDYFNNDLSALGRASLEDLTQFKGIGHAKAITILPH